MKFGFKKLRRKEIIPEDAILRVLWNIDEKKSVSAICQEMERFFGQVYNANSVQEKLNEACTKGLIIAQETTEGLQYFPAMSENAYNEMKLREYEAAMAACPAKSYVMPMSSRKLTEEEYERLKKLIDELD